MFKIGDMVKIEDIGTLAVCIETKKNEIWLELDGNRFWISKRFCRAVRKGAA